MRCTFVLLAGLLAGCASAPVSELRGPDGAAVKTVKCSAETTKCFDAAVKSCQVQGTYQVLASESHAGGLLVDMMPGPVTWYSMTYVCGSSDGKLPDFKRGGQPYVPPPPDQAIFPQLPKTTTTNCTKLGDTVRCTSN